MKVRAFITVQKVVEFDVSDDITALQMAEMLDDVKVPDGYEWCNTVVTPADDDGQLLFEF